ncbi:MAG: CoA-binding protein [Candidatus Marsarchaeota archaeon]|nr:CoA-binding protein [Candidatus Marsarchaeota archaeon]
MSVDVERRILENSKVIAVVGCSREPGKPSHDIPEYLKSVGYRIIPVNPNAEEILGERSYKDLKSIGERVDVVDVFRPSSEALRVTEEAFGIGAKAVWLQLGIVSDEAERFAKSHGMDFVMNRCMMVEYITLGINRRVGSPP